MPTLAKKPVVRKKTFDKTRSLSWSAISSFMYDKEQWYRKYVLGQPDPASKEMIFGKLFADSCENGEPLAPVTILCEVEKKFEIVFNKIPMIGYADTYCKKTKKVIGEYKTGKKAWDQKRVDDHGQITLYALFNYITYKVKPEDCEFFLEWIPTEEHGDFSINFKKPIKVHHFKTKRTMQDILNFGMTINRIYKEMENYCENHI